MTADRRARAALAVAAATVLVGLADVPGARAVPLGRSTVRTSPELAVATQTVTLAVDGMT